MSRIKTQIGFTIIELLVVVSIVALLATIILPSLQRAREETRRKVCLSNMRQIYQYFYSYQNDQAGWLPINSGYAGPGDSAYSPSSQYDDDAVTGVNGVIGDTVNPGATGWAIMLNGNAAQASGYRGAEIDKIPIKLVNCPSNDFPYNGSFFLLNYAYRYNSDRVDFGNWGWGIAPNHIAYGRDALNDPQRSWRPLFTDAADYRLNPATMTPVTKTTTTTSIMWSHFDGGNMLRHDGAGKWKPNSKLYPGRAGWPFVSGESWGWAISEVPEYEQGLDEIFRDP